MKIKKKDLVNLCRHIYLCGYNSNSGIHVNGNLDQEWETDREGCIEDFIKDIKEEGFMCYNNSCGSKKHNLHTRNESHETHRAKMVEKTLADRGFNLTEDSQEE